MHQRVYDVLEHHPVRDPATVAAQRMTGVKLRPLTPVRAKNSAQNWLQQA